MILGTSDAWSKSRLSHRPNEPAYYILDLTTSQYGSNFLPASKRHYGILFIFVFLKSPLLNRYENQCQVLEIISWFQNSRNVLSPPPARPPFTRALNYMPTQPRPTEVELRPELTTKVSCLLLGRSHIVSFFKILPRFYVRKWIKSSKEPRLCQLFCWYSSRTRLQVWVKHSMMICTIWFRDIH